MKKYHLVRAALSLALITQYACVHRPARVASQATTVAGAEERLNIQTTSFEEIGHSGILMFHLGMGEHVRKGGSASYKEMPYATDWNLLFLDTRTNTHHLLGDHKMLIHGVYTGEGNGTADSAVPPYIFYRITAEDHDTDKLFTDKDPVSLFFTDREGYHMRRASPAGGHVIGWTYIAASGKVFMTVQQDSNHDLVFDEDDEVATYAIRPETDSIPYEVFPAAVKDSLKTRYARDWRRLKK
ncbi:hypothetical protein [Taibaiella helva]|uniref:hypothetical protein n=1 Tax=Taibaiella helva TaxID=2301235 RepID=UPI000E57D730|nr:hypothetical protein [Taibaiella helva]